MARLAMLLGARAGDPVKGERFRVVGEPGAVKNIVPSSAVVEALMRLRMAGGASGSVFHVANANPPTMEDLVDSVAQVIGLRDCRLVQCLETRDATVAERSFHRMAQAYQRYMLDSDPVFDMRNTLAAIGPIPMPRVRSAYLRKRILSYFVAAYGVNYDQLPQLSAAVSDACVGMP
jgi:nucleoside-diphosphate-sugar epimerase